MLAEQGWRVDFGGGCGVEIRQGGAVAESAARSIARYERHGPCRLLRLVNGAWEEVPADA